MEPVVYGTQMRMGRGPGRGAERLVFVLVVLVLIAVVKPWGSPPAAETVPPLRATGTATGTATPTDRVPVGDHPCTGRHWLIQSDIQLSDRLVRSWVPADAVEASGPRDPTITFVPVVSRRVLAIGYCPAVDDDVPLGTRLTVYRLGRSIEVVPAEAIPITEPGASENALFRPAVPAGSQGPAGSPRAPEEWGSGRYAMRIDGANGFSRWLGVEIRILTAEASD